MKTHESYRIERVDNPRTLEQALALVETVFMEFVAPGFSEQGINEFFGFANFERIKKEMDSSLLALWVCYYERKMVGVLGIETRGHVCLLFVSGSSHKRGIARAMLEKGLAFCRQKGLTQISVNSSTYAVAAYKRMGFVATQPEKCVNGIRHVPMTLSLIEQAAL